MAHGLERADGCKCVVRIKLPIGFQRFINLEPVFCMGEDTVGASVKCTGMVNEVLHRRLFFNL